MLRFSRYSNLWLSFSLLVSASSCSTFSDWQSGSLEHRKFKIQRLWVRETMIKETLKFRKMNRFSPLIAEVSKAAGAESTKGSLLIQGNSMDSITAYSIDDGRVAWRLPISNGVETSAVLEQGKLFFGASDGQFYSVKLETGEVEWTYPVRQEVLSKPTVDDNVVYFLSGANTLYALSTETGKALWLYNRQDPSQLSIRGGSRPAVRGGTVYAGFSDGSLVALTAGSGTVKWEKKLNKNKKFRDLDSDPLVDGEFLYVMGYDDAIYCLRAASGDLVWKTSFGGYGEFLKNGNRIYVATTSEEFVALDAESGKKIWSIPTKEAIATGATLIRGLISFGDSSGELHFVEPGSGRKVGSFFPGSGIHASPTALDSSGALFFISNEATLYSLKIGWAQASEIPFLR